MPTVMPHKEWMKLTYGGVTSIRSGKLKAVDTALERYHKQPDEAQLDALRKALMAWMGDKGSDWKSSVRNAHNAVETLHKQVMGLHPGGPGGEAAGVRAMKDEARQVMLLTMRGARITWKNEFRGKLNLNLADPSSNDFITDVMKRQYMASASTNKWGLAGNTAGLAVASKTIHTMRTGGGGDATGMAIGKLVSQVVPASAQREVMSAVQALVPTFQVQFAAAVMPLTGVLVAAGTTFWNTGNALHKQYGVMQTRMHRERSLAGVEARSAINALIRILERERNADIYSAGVSFAEFGGKIAGLAIDGGVASNTAIGLAANIAKLLNIVRIVYRDVSEKNAANRLLASGEIDLDVFETCPLLGCYLICCLPHSALMALILDRFGDPGWMDMAERTVVHHLNPLREKARSVIAAHRFEVRSLARFPGMLGVNTKELERMQANVGKSRYEGGGAGAFPDRVAA